MSNNPTGHEIYYEVTLRTGPDGRWRTDSVPPGAEAVNLQLIHPDFVCDGCWTTGTIGRSLKVAALRDQTDRQVLIKGAKIRGRVLDEKGKPIAGAKVVDSTRGMSFLDHVWRTVTDAEGHFHVHLPRGAKMSLTVQAAGHQPAMREISAEMDAQPVEFRLGAGKRLRGRVVDPQGQPIAGAFVIIPSYAKYQGVVFRRWTDAQGRFEWDSAPEESVVLSIGAAGYRLIDPVAIAPGGQEAVIVLKPAIDVRLRVIDAETDKPIPRFGIQIGTARPDTTGFRWQQTKNGGRAGDYRTALSDVSQGSYRFKILADGYEPAESRVFRGEETTAREVIRLQKSRK